MEAEVLALDRAWGQAYITGDVAFVDNLLAPEWSAWSDGERTDKAAALEELRAGQGTVLENVIDRASVRVYGETAIVEARERVRSRQGERESWLTMRITDVFVRRDDRWQVVATHESKIPNP